MEGFINDTREALEEFLLDEQGRFGIISPDYIAWSRQDQLFISWLLAYMIEEILAQMVGCNISANTREAFSGIFASQSIAKIM